MAEIDIFGEGNCNINSSALEIDFTPDTWHKVIPKFNVSKVLKKYSYFGSRNKLNTKLVEDYNIFQIIVKNIDTDDWEDVLKVIQNEKIVFTPHIDRPDLRYICNVVDLDLDWKDKILFDIDETVIYLKESQYINRTLYEYYLLDGVDDYIQAPITTYGSTWTLELTYNANSLADLDDCILAGSYASGTNWWYLKINSSGYLEFKRGLLGATNALYTDTVVLPVDTDWHTLKLEVDHSARTVKIWYDDVARTLTETTKIGTNLMSGVYMQIGRYNTTYALNIALSNIKLTSSTSSYDFEYDGSELYQEAPYTGCLIDQSGNDNDGTPVNITNTFFNVTDEDI